MRPLAKRVIQNIHVYMWFLGVLLSDSSGCGEWVGTRMRRAERVMQGVRSRIG